MNIKQLQPPDAEKLFSDLVNKIQPDINENIMLVGVRTGGVWLAQRLHQELCLTHPLGILDISFYRDDFDRIGLYPKVKPSEIPFEVTDSHIILVDDILYTGRTIRAAINELFDYGRPASIRLAILVDRGERELPIAAQYVGAELVLPSGKMLNLQQGGDGKLSLSLHDKQPPE